VSDLAVHRIVERSSLKREAIARAICSVILVLLVGCRGDVVITPEDETETSEPLSTATASPSRESVTTEGVLPTPATLTPTASPTPNVHVVQAGETLSAIAAIYDVSVQALQAANGIDNPLLLQAGQELIIPTGEEVADEQPSTLLPTPTPLPIGRQGVGFYETPVGSLWCLGEVVNTTSLTLTNVLVQVTLYDSSGTPVLEGDAFAAADVLIPSARAPFGMLFLSPPPDFTSHQVTILRSEPVGQLGERYFPLSIDELNGAPLDPQFEVTGSVSNPDGTRMAAVAVVVVTTYDEEGRVTGFRQQMVDVGDGLTPGASAPFRILLTAHGQSPASFSVIGFGRVETEDQAGE
jgi:LysM repeat protein